MVKDTDFKFDKHIQGDSPDKTRPKIFQKGAWPGSRDPLNFWGLNANCWNTVKGTDFKFDEHVHRDSPHGQSGRDPLENFRKGGVARVR